MYRRLGVVSLVVWACALSAWGQQPAGLFIDAPSASSRALPPSDTITRSRTVYINETTLPTPGARSGDRAHFNLFEDASFDVVVENVSVRTPQRYTWTGRIVGDEYSGVTVSVNGEVVQGTLQSPTLGDYEIRYLKDGLHRVSEMDLSKLGPCGNGPAPAIASTATPGRPLGPITRGGIHQVDLLVVYSPAAREHLGGKEAIEAIIDMAVADGNTYYAPSLVDIQLNLVDTFEIAYTESGSFDSALYALQDQNDGFMDEVHAARNSTGADIVSLIIDHTQYCGQGFLLFGLGQNTQTEGFNALSSSCMSSGFVLTHELGHNMGGGHDLNTEPHSGLFPYSIGWHFGDSTNPGHDGDYRTVMAYAPGANSRRISNPDVLFMGEPTGLAGVANNALTFNTSAPTVSGWRQTASWVRVIPVTALSSAGPMGGPFTPTSIGFTLTNGDSTNANWLVSSSQPWAVPTPASGMLTPGASTAVNVNFGALANALDTGTHSAIITFTDVTNARSFPYTIRLKTMADISETVQYHFPMDTQPVSWARAGLWEFGVPQGNGTNNPDPTAGRTGANVYGYNLAGDYTNNMPAYALRTSVLNCSNLDNVGLVFWRWLGVEQSIFDKAKIQVSLNNSTWTDVWVHEGGELAETAWSKQSYDLSFVADRQPVVYVRWVMGASDSNLTFSGWNIDDVSITGDPVAPAMSNNVWVNFANTGVEKGTLAQPYSSVAEGTDYLNPSGTLHIAAGASAEMMTISQPMTIVAEGGLVRIGSATP